MADKQNLAKESQLALKQDTLIAGANITIAADGKTISAANSTSITVTPIYQAGTLVAAIVVNGNTTNIYAPQQHGDNSNQNLAAPFSASSTYAVDDYVIYQENLYKCITAITTAAAWDSTKWTRVLITNEMGSGSGGDYANQNIADTYDITSTYAVGDYVIFNSLLYKCITAVTTPGVWNSSYWAHVLVTNEMGSGGGSSVIPNPQDPATDTLTTIEINGTVYDIAGGGGGSGYTETTLWSGNETPSTAGTDINLSGNISDYDAIAIHVGNSYYTGDNIFLISSLTIGETYISTVYHGENLGAFFTYVSDIQINIKRQATSYPQEYTKVIGIKYGEGGGGGDANKVELTYDEYEALTPAEKNNDTMYFITDINEYDNNTEFQPIIYSETEREIGVWVDGKPLYQKVWIFDPYISIGTSFSTSSNIDSTNIGDITYVYCLHEDGTGYCDMMADPTRDSHTLLGLKASEAHNVTRLILQYTKISDAAGSGIWTPQGVPTVHYDTNEKVIGTWLNGDTIYEKTIHYTDLSGVSDWTVLDNSVSYDKLIDLKGVRYTPSNECQTFANGLDLMPRFMAYSNNLYYYTSSTITGDIYITIRYTKSSS